MSFKSFSIRTGYIYFAQMENTGPIKIGISTDPHKRMASINTGSPYPITLLYFTPGCEEDEKALHREFMKFSIRNEWFHPVKEIFKSIEWKKQIDRKYEAFMWENYNPERDLGDWTFESEKWNEPWIIEINNRIESQFN